MTCQHKSLRLVKRGCVRNADGYQTGNARLKCRDCGMVEWYFLDKYELEEVSTKKSLTNVSARAIL